MLSHVLQPVIQPVVNKLAFGLWQALQDDGFNPATLFSDGSKGVLYDNNDLTSFYLDSAGTTPATVNGLVGLQLDKSQGLVLGAELSSYSTGFSSTAGITANGVTVSLSSGSLLITATSTDGVDRAEIPISGLTVGKYYLVTVVARRGVQGTQQSVRSSTCFDIPFFPILTTSATTYTHRTAATATSGVIRVYAADGPGAIGDEVYVNSISVRELPGNHRYQTTTGSKPVLRGTPTGLNLFASYGTPGTGWANSGGGVATATATTGSIPTNVVPANTRVYRVRYTATVTSGTVRLTMGGVNGATRSASGTYEEYIAATSTAALSFQGVTAFTGTVSALDVRDVTADSVTAPYGLQYDGVDDFLTTASVDFTATDKMAVVMGVRKLSDAARGFLVEQGVGGVNGTFSIEAPGIAAEPSYRSGSRGTLASTVASPLSYAAPITNVVGMVAEIGTDTLTIRVNGAQVASIATDQGTGNFSNNALYFGRRAGTSNPLNGLDYGGIINGKAWTAAQLASVERWTAQRTPA